MATLTDYAGTLAANWPPPDQPTPLEEAGDWPDVLIEVAFDHDTFADTGLVLNDPVKGKLDVAQLSGETDSWTDITRYGRKVSIRRRWNVETRVWEPAAVSVELRNEDRRFDPLDSGSPYYPGVVPMRQVRISAVLGGQTKALFTGYVDSWDGDWNMPVEGIAVMKATDAAKPLAGAALGTVTPLGQGDTTGERIARVLDTVEWPTAARQLQTGSVTMPETDYDDTALGHIRKCALAEMGSLNVTAEGLVRFRPRHALIRDSRSRNSQAVFGDSGSEIHYQELEVDYDAPVVNEVKAKRDVQNAEEQVASDATSITKYFRQSKTMSQLQVESDTQALANADYWVDLFADPYPRVTHLKIIPKSAAHWATVLSLDLEDRITTRRRPRRASGTIELDGHVVEISHDIKPAGQAGWSVTLATTPTRPLDDVFVLDDVTNGVLGTARLGA